MLLAAAAAAGSAVQSPGEYTGLDHFLGWKGLHKQQQVDSLCQLGLPVLWLVVLVLLVSPVAIVIIIPVEMHTQQSAYISNLSARAFDSVAGSADCSTSPAQPPQQ
jgi:hypothetical protein